jgi:hypothetical protein
MALACKSFLFCSWPFCIFLFSFCVPIFLSTSLRVAPMCTFCTFLCFVLLLRLLRPFDSRFVSSVTFLLPSCYSWRTTVHGRCPISGDSGVFFPVCSIPRLLRFRAALPLLFHSSLFFFFSALFFLFFWSTFVPPSSRQSIPFFAGVQSFSVFVSHCACTTNIDPTSPTCSFLDDLDRIAQKDYTPSDADVVRARLRTLGVQEYRIHFQGHTREFVLPPFPFSFLFARFCPFLPFSQCAFADRGAGVGSHGAAISNDMGQDWILYDVGGSRTTVSVLLVIFVCVVLGEG